MRTILCMDKLWDNFPNMASLKVFYIFKNTFFLSNVLFKGASYNLSHFISWPIWSLRKRGALELSGLWFSLTTFEVVTLTVKS